MSIFSWFHRSLWGISLGVLSVLAAFAATSAESVLPGQVETQTEVGTVATSEPTLTLTEAPTLTPTAAPLATLSPNTILIWWPAPLYPTEKMPAADILKQQISEYEAQHPGITISVRVKRAEGPGNIYQTLHSGSIVAPSAMPDLALMRRSDLVQTASEKLIQPIDFSALAIDDMFLPDLGKVGDTQYGIPYMLEAQHFVVNRSSLLTQTPYTLDNLLQAKMVMLFPASRPNGVNTMFLAQYIAAGGHIVNDAGQPALDKTPLEKVLRYYEQAAQNRLVGPQLLDYATTAQYWPLFLSDQSTAAQVDSTTFLAEHNTLSDVQVMPLPTLDGSPINAVDGWMWVIVSPNADKRAKVQDVISWFLQADQQGAFAHGLGVLPSRQSALQAWDSTDSYIAFVKSLFQAPTTPFPDAVPQIAADALQKAFEDVISGRKSAEFAANDAVLQVESVGVQ